MPLRLLALVLDIVFLMCSSLSGASCMLLALPALAGRQLACGCCVGAGVSIVGVVRRRLPASAPVYQSRRPESGGPAGHGADFPAGVCDDLIYAIFNFMHGMLAHM